MQSIHFRRLSLPDNTISTLAELLGYRVSFVDDEVLVEYLEHLSPLKVCHGGEGVWERILWNDGFSFLMGNLFSKSWSVVRRAM
jgi:hypothetical protein